MRARAVTSETPACCSMRARKRLRASPKWPRVNSLCARSKALSAAASSREGCLGAGAGREAVRGADLAANFLAGGAAFFSCALGCCLVGAFLLRAAERDGAAARVLVADFLAAGAL